MTFLQALSKWTVHGGPSSAQTPTPRRSIDRSTPVEGFPAPRAGGPGPAGCSPTSGGPAWWGGHGGKAPGQKSHPAEGGRGWAGSHDLQDPRGQAKSTRTAARSTNFLSCWAGGEGVLGYAPHFLTLRKWLLSMANRPLKVGKKANPA